MQAAEQAGTAAKIHKHSLADEALEDEDEKVILVKKPLSSLLAPTAAFCTLADVRKPDLSYTYAV